MAIGLISKMKAMFGGAPTPAGPRVLVAGFGKHPGWDDHIEDLGILDHTLSALKQGLYDHGIVTNIDTGAWERLSSEQRLPEFDHLIVQSVDQDLVLGRCWSSIDGRGRAKYPMLLVIRCQAAPTDWQFSHVLPQLEKLGETCRAATTSDAVHSAVSMLNQRLAGEIGAVSGESAVLPPPTTTQDELTRLMYALDANTGFINRHPAKSISATTGLRVTSNPVAVLQEIQGWLGLLRRWIAPSISLLFIAARGQPWLDIIVGQHDGGTVFCLRATPQALPLVRDIPYEFNDAFRARAAAVFSSSAM